MNTNSPGRKLAPSKHRSAVTDRAIAITSRCGFRDRDRAGRNFSIAFYFTLVARFVRRLHYFSICYGSEREEIEGRAAATICELFV